MDENQEGKLPQEESLVQETNSVKKSKKLKWGVGVVAVAVVCVAVFVMIKFMILKPTAKPSVPTNFLNISWDLTLDEALEVAIRQIEETETKYFVDYWGHDASIKMFSDPFFGLGDDMTSSVHICEKSDGSGLEEISFITAKQISRQAYKNKVEELSEIYGEPSETKETVLKISGGMIRETFWHLPETNIKASLFLDLLTIEFTPNHAENLSLEENK